MPLTLGIRYLTGYAVAATRPDGDPEWPPHPARVFMALAAAHFESGGDPHERRALEWLESLEEQPALSASDADVRTGVTHFVPINDKPVGKHPGLLQTVPGWPRSKQARTFPRVRPHDDSVFLIWNTDCPAEHRSTLQSLCGNVTRLGHSSSLVQMWVADAEAVPPANWVPEDVTVECSLRKITPGLLSRLEADCNLEEIDMYADFEWRMEAANAKEKRRLRRERDERFPHGPPERLRPSIGTWQGYRRPVTGVNGDLSGTVWEAGLVTLRLEPKETGFPRLDLLSTLQVTQRMHESVLYQADKLTEGNVPEFVSGHRSTGSASDRPHLAYLPLAFAGSQYADGHLMGIAVAVPGGLRREERRLAWSAIREIDHLKLGRLGVWELQPEDREFPPQNLRPETWTAAENGARQWATVTPIAFDHHPKAKDRATYQQELAAMVARGCRRIGLPEPREVIPTPVSAHEGVPAATEFPKLKRKDGSKRRHTHAILVFEEPVRGPVSLCAGRYRGYGFCRPLYGRKGRS